MKAHGRRVSRRSRSTRRKRRSQRLGQAPHLASPFLCKRRRRRSLTPVSGRSLLPKRRIRMGTQSYRPVLRTRKRLLVKRHSSGESSQARLCLTKERRIRVRSISRSALRARSKHGSQRSSGPKIRSHVLRTPSLKRRLRLAPTLLRWNPRVDLPRTRATRLSSLA